MEENTQSKELAITEDLKPILGILKEKDAEAIIALKEELANNWNKKQIFRTETEMRVSVLNDGKHPTPASKYWQSVREMSAHFDALMGLSFEMRRNQIERMKLEQKMLKAIEKGDQLKQLELQVDLDQNLYGKANMEQVAQDRVRELKLWSQIKAELNDGSFDDQNVNTHQATSLRLILQNRTKALGPHSAPSEIINAIGPLQTVERLNKDGKLLTFTEAKLQLAQNSSQSESE
jgi:hypothetical protein